MKSGKQRRAEIRASRIKKAQKHVASVNETPWEKQPIEGPRVEADHSQIQHSYSTCLPLYYYDRAFECATCGVSQLWTAKQQKWWYEIAKGDFNSTAKYCRPCRKANREKKAAERNVHYRGLVEKRGIVRAAKLLHKSQEYLEKHLKIT